MCVKNTVFYIIITNLIVFWSRLVIPWSCHISWEPLGYNNHVVKCPTIFGNFARTSLWWAFRRNIPGLERKRQITAWIGYYFQSTLLPKAKHATYSILSNRTGVLLQYFHTRSVCVVLNHVHQSRVQVPMCERWACLTTHCYVWLGSSLFRENESFYYSAPWQGHCLRHQNPLIHPGVG